MTDTVEATQQALSAPMSTLAGVGIVFQPQTDGALVVMRLIPNEPAERSGLVHVGDVLLEVDGVDVYRKAITEVQPLLLGQPDSSVRLTLERREGQSFQVARIALQRSSFTKKDQVGVGLVLRVAEDGLLTVKRLAEDGPAFVSGMIKVGDVLVEVDGIDVVRKPSKVVTDLLMGNPGSSAKLGFIRPSRGSEVFFVTLSRRSGAVQAGELSQRASVRLEDVGAGISQDLGPSAAAPLHALDPSELRAKVQELQSLLDARNAEVNALYEVARKGTSTVGGRMNVENHRLRTFHKWPHKGSGSSGLSAQTLAQNGFYFAPNASHKDRIVCYFCGVQLSELHKSDNIRILHAKTSSDCRIVKGALSDNVPIAAGDASLRAELQRRLDAALRRKGELMEEVNLIDGELLVCKQAILKGIQLRREYASRIAVVRTLGR